jgi:predicted enzyme related to lactoylglutathione lyase
VSTPSSDVGLAQVEQIAIIVHDVDRAVRFYRPEFDHPSSIIYYRVADIQAAHQTLVARGVSFRGEPHVVHRAPDHELWMAFFYDVDRNTLALTCRKALG